MTDLEPTAELRGLTPPGATGPSPLLVHPGEVWLVGRRDVVYLAAHDDLAARHLAVPDARPDLSVNQLEIRVGTVGVSVTSQRDAGVTVDGTLRPSPVVLGAGTSHINPTTSGLHLDFAVTVLRSDLFPAGARPLTASGTTLLLRIPIEPHSTTWRVAHALAWPCMPCSRRPHNVGWSGRDVAERLDQLGWTHADSRPGAEITQLGRQLLALADRVENGRLTDGRRADQVFAAWPPWMEDAPRPDETRDQRAERRNRCVAEALWRAQSVTMDVIDRR